MTTRATTTSRSSSPSSPSSTEIEHANEVRLVGRVSGDPQEVVLPSGDTVWNFRLVVDRPAERARPGQPVDTLDCAVWSGRTKRSVSSWRAGDVVEVEGAVRRRFYAAAGGKASRYEVEVLRGRVIRRAGTG
jgi:single-strand DNA-binding protein